MPEDKKKTREEIAAENKRKLAADTEAARQVVVNAQQSAPQANSGATGKVDTNNADVISQSGTQSQQNSVSNSASVNSGTSVSEQQGRAVSSVEEGLTPDQMAERATLFAKAHPGYILNDKGEVVRDPNAALFDALQIDRKRLSDERERQEELQRKKKLAHGLANSAMLISDMISAGIGGNVYKRDKDNTGEEADKEIARLHEAQIADDIAAKTQEKQERDKWAADLWKDLNDYRRDYLRRVSENNTSGTNQSIQSGQQVTTSQQSGKSNTVQTSKYTPEYLAATHKGGLTVDKNGNLIFGGGGGGKGTAVANVRVTTANGEELQQIYLPDYAREELVNTAHTLLQEAINTGEISADDLKGFYTPERKSGAKHEPAKWNDDNLLSSEIVLRQPRILNTFINKIIEQGYEINGKPISRADAYMLITGINPYGTDGKIDANKVLHGIVLNGVAGRSAVNGDGSAGMFEQH